MTAKVILKSRKAKPLWWGAAWVFEASIDRLKSSGSPADGDLVEVLDAKGRRIGEGLWSGKGMIRVRMVSRGEERFDDEALASRLRRAIALRHDVLRLPDRATAYRVVHAEGDGLPGLVIDRAGDWLVIQTDVAGMQRRLDHIVEVLTEELAPRGIFQRFSRLAREQEGLEGEDSLLSGEAPNGPVEVREDATRFLVDLEQGQKTGFYCDQRDNRAWLSGLVKGRRVLDAFSYVGGFGLRMLQEGGAASVLLRTGANSGAGTLLQATVCLTTRARVAKGSKPAASKPARTPPSYWRTLQ